LVFNRNCRRKAKREVKNVNEHKSTLGCLTWRSRLYLMSRSKWVTGPLTDPMSVLPKYSSIHFKTNRINGLVGLGVLRRAKSSWATLLTKRQERCSKLGFGSEMVWAGVELVCVEEEGEDVNHMRLCLTEKLMSCACESTHQWGHYGQRRKVADKSPRFSEIFSQFIFPHIFWFCFVLLPWHKKSKLKVEEW
jgi:hypothetical protein